MLFWADYYLRWWRLPIEERAFRNTDLGSGDYYLRNSGLSLPRFAVAENHNYKEDTFGYIPLSKVSSFIGNPVYLI